MNRPHRTRTMIICRLRRALLTIACVAVAAAACTSSAEVEQTEADLEADRQHAEAILLVGDDIGPGWEPTRRDTITTRDELEILAELRSQSACDAVVANLERFGDTVDIFPPAPAEAESPRWDDGLGNDVQFDVSIYATEAEAEGLFTAAVEADLSSCYAAAFPAIVEDLLADDPTITASNLVVEEIVDLPIADDGYGYRMQVTLEGGGSSLIVSTEFALLRHGRVVYEGMLSTLGGAYSIEDDIAPLMVQRLYDVNVRA